MTRVLHAARISMLSIAYCKIKNEKKLKNLTHSLCSRCLKGRGGEEREGKNRKKKRRKVEGAGGGTFNHPISPLPSFPVMRLLRRLPSTGIVTPFFSDKEN